MPIIVTDADLDAAAESQDLDRALAGIFEKIDPNNTLDLGGEASLWFSGDAHYIAPMDNGPTKAPIEEAWSYLDRDDRRGRLAQFFRFVGAKHA